MGRHMRTHVERCLVFTPTWCSLSIDWYRTLSDRLESLVLYIHTYIRYIHTHVHPLCIIEEWLSVHSACKLFPIVGLFPQENTVKILSTKTNPQPYLALTSKPIATPSLSGPEHVHYIRSLNIHLYQIEMKQMTLTFQ